MDEHRHTHRHQVLVQRNCALGVITFKELLWTDHQVHLVDISRTGLGVESETRLEPGFVWFGERVGGHKGGVLLWSRRNGACFRAGIRFVPLSSYQEQALERPGRLSSPPRPHRDPEEIIATLMDSLTKYGH